MDDLKVSALALIRPFVCVLIRGLPLACKVKASAPQRELPERRLRSLPAS